MTPIKYNAKHTVHAYYIKGTAIYTSTSKLFQNQAEYLFYVLQVLVFVRS